jgi:ribosomal protein S18 acetylase RimI-like enzyme
MANIYYVETDVQGLDLIKPLWEQLTQHHKARSRYFKEIYDTFTFEKRKDTLVNKSKDGSLRVDLAKDMDTGRYVGYCISSIGLENEGEIDSIFIEEAYRSSGIGHSLMGRALAWLDDHQVSVKRVAVAVGNEEALEFYGRYGFLPRQIILEQKKK